CVCVWLRGCFKHYHFIFNLSVLQTAPSAHSSPAQKKPLWPHPPVSPLYLLSLSVSLSLSLSLSISLSLSLSLSVLVCLSLSPLPPRTPPPSCSGRHQSIAALRSFTP